ncbi:MAG: ATP-binding protein [Alphaproteobacteria bacterium]|nr:ATP-binding protein [Alphaproteobacteria bacterium]
MAKTPGKTDGEPPIGDGLPSALKADELCRICDPASLGFKTTDELKEPRRIIGQDRAVEAIRFGVGIAKEGYNMFALGPSGTGKYSVIRQFLEGRAEKLATPPDTCYVNNFPEPHRPNLIQLPAGRGAPFREDMDQLVELVRVAIPRAFEAEDYRAKRKELETRFKQAHDEIFADVQREAEENSIALVRTPAGVVLAPVRNGQVIPPEAFEQFPDDAKERIQTTIEGLQEKLREALAEMPKLERQIREEVRSLNQGTTMFAVGHLIDDLKSRYQDQPEVLDYLDQVRDDIVEHVEDFLRGDGEAAQGPMAQLAERAASAGLNRYKVNLLVDNGKSKGAPVVYEDLPNLQSLIGRIEHIAQFGTLMTDFSLIQPGALHRANGGYLILDARKVLMAPFAWEQLKRSLKSREVRIESPEKILSVATTITLEPEPMPLDVKVVLLGDRLLYYLLTQADPEFSELFKVEVDFEESWDRTPENMALFSRFLAQVIRHQKLRPFDAAAVARVIEHAARMAGDSTKMTTHIRTLADLLEEADYWAGTNGNGTVGAADVARALEAKIERADRIRDVSYEQIEDRTILIETRGEAVGQINGLSVMQLGKFPFGRPTRITARVRLGRGQVVDIEREVELGGPIHSKGVLILSGFLGARFCTELPLSLAASLVFEQSYSGVEGDSASSTELYALLSALAEVPIKQSLAVTGSVNQYGQVQAIGGANEKIEGFYDICKIQGLTGEQGVLIPRANVKHLMLRKDVIEAVGAGQFHIYPVDTIDQGIALLTGREAGVRGADGQFPAESINGLVEARLQAFAEAARRFARRSPDDGGDGEPGQT